MAWWVITPEVTDEKGRKTASGRYGPFRSEFQAQQKQDKLEVDSEKIHTLSANWAKARGELVLERSEKVGHMEATVHYRNLGKGVLESEDEY